MAIDQQRSSSATGPIRVPKSAEIVADLFRKRIILGELKEGDALPPEGQLLTSLGISRPTLREALRILEAEGLITVVRGSRTGARVHQPKVEGVARYASFVLQSLGTTVADIYEARLAIEPYVAGQLALKRPAGATERLRHEADRLTRLVDHEQYVEFMGGLADFHKALLEVGGNKTLLFLNQTLYDLVIRWQIGVLGRSPTPPDVQRRQCLSGVRSFYKLIDLIDSGDAAKAEAHWRLHMINANKAWVSGQEQDVKLNIFS